MTIITASGDDPMQGYSTARRGISATGLKLIACLSMLTDHIGYLLLPETLWLRVIGRIAFPLFALMAGESLRYTRNIRRLLLRLLLFGIAFQPIFRLCMGGEMLNIFITLLLGLLAALCFERLWSNDGLLRQLAAAFVLVLFAVLAELIKADFGWYGILLIFSGRFFFSERKKLLLSWLLLNICHIMLGGSDLQLFSLAALPVFFLYNGSRGAGLKWFFYSFYCLHIPLLWLIAQHI